MQVICRSVGKKPGTGEEALLMNPLAESSQSSSSTSASIADMSKLTSLCYQARFKIFPINNHFRLQHSLELKCWLNWKRCSEHLDDLLYILAVNICRMEHGRKNSSNWRLECFIQVYNCWDMFIIVWFFCFSACVSCDLWIHINTVDCRPHLQSWKLPKLY